MKYSAPLDGIRAIAILAVLVYHAAPGALPGGFTGVDVFFVLSGYLIASVILYDLRDGTFTMREFYLRRVQRLLPNAATTVLVTVALAAVLLPPLEAAGTARHGVWTLLNVSNLYIWRNVGGYWGNSGEYTPFLHTWSLAVEEQFYAFFPAVLLVLSRRRAARIVGVIALLVLGSFALSLWGSSHKPGATFYLLPTRAWEPLLGALLAAIRVPSSASSPIRPFASTRVTTAVGWLGLGSIVAGSFVASGAVPFPGVVGLLPTLGSAAVIAAVAEGQGSLSSLLSRRPLPFIGQLSYSLYLWHWPGIVFGRFLSEFDGYPKRQAELVGLGAGIVAAVVAFYVIEQPLRRRGEGRGKRIAILSAQVLAAGAACMVLALNLKPVNTEKLFDRPNFYVALYNAAGDGITDPGDETGRFGDVERPRSEPRPADSWRNGGILRAWGTGAPQVVVLGSSHATVFGKVIDDICREMGIPVAFLCADGIPSWVGNDPRFPFLEEFEEARNRHLSAWKPSLVIVVDRIDGDTPARYSEAFANLAKDLSGRTGRVVFLGQVPALSVGESVNLRQFVAWRTSRFGRLPDIHPAESDVHRKRNLELLREVVRRQPGFELLTFDDVFILPGGGVRYAEGRKFLYADDDHLSQEGAELVKGRIARVIGSSLAAWDRDAGRKTTAGAPRVARLSPDGRLLDR